ncbi:Gfo/Idh/MocA family protein [Pseudoclavibacter terrae]|uniref:Gfo/Idh/MocA family protein n=1 Tax=Pseudoclavibacter terrae TaxID=1530195 RepID=UPI00232F2D1D|nr:Gfo/Idh/MocA family oxidoreductase [Pseudoclavibacter terrae]
MAAPTRIGIGIIGTGWMARAHTRALQVLRTAAELPFDVELSHLAGRDPARTDRAAEQWGVTRASTDWRALVDDPAVDVVVNLTGNDTHAAPSIAALQLDKHVLCEKPLAISAVDLERMLAAAQASTAIAACGYNYRFVPALRVAKELLESGGLGELRQFSIGYEQDWASLDADRTGWRFDDHVAGSCVYDLSHILDLLRWFTGDPTAVVANIATRGKAGEGARPAALGVDPEDSYEALATLGTGTTAVLRASRIATGRKGRQFVELTGSLGTVTWDMEDMNRLKVFLEGDRASGVAGFRDVLVTETEHPFMRHWYAPGHTIGWDDTVLHQWISLIGTITGFDPNLPSDVATFEDGARAVQFADAIRESSATRSWVTPTWS